MNTLRKLGCWWNGHIHDHSQSEGSICTNCDEWHSWDETLGARYHIWSWWHFHRPVWMRPIAFFRKCPDCGQRFNRHTDDCPPF